MKKAIFVGLLSVIMMSGVANADWSFQWYNTSAIYCPDGGGGSIILPDSSLAYTFGLYLSSDANFQIGVDTLCFEQTGLQVGAGPGYFYGGAANTATTPAIPLLSDPTYDYVISVIFQGNSGTYTAYAVLGSEQLPASDPSLIPDDQYIDPAGISAANVNATWVVVPEPSTVGLLLVGAGLVVFRRMRRS